MNREEVKNNEEADLFSNKDEFLYYTTGLNNYFFLLEYLFYDDKLIRSKYLLLDKFVIENKYIDVLFEFEKIMIKQYGDNYEKDIVWTNDVYKGQQVNIGKAVMLGYLYGTFYKK